MVTHREIEIDQRKWRLFIFDNRDKPKGYTKESIWDHRLQEAQRFFEQSRYSEFFPPNGFPRMLIIGAGLGAEIKVAQTLGYKAIGIGFLNQEQLEYALQQGVDFRVMDMHDLKFPNGSFDVVYSNMSFEHGVHPWLMCVEVWAVLRKGGRWWINLPTWQHSDTDGPGHQHFMILDSWFMMPMLKRSGFKIVYHEDNKIAYKFLLEKLELDELPADFKNITAILRKRLEIGESYG